jgi:hypothetical protein
MASLPQEITRDVLLPWWRAFREADENSYLRWMQDYDFDEFYTVEGLFDEFRKEFKENCDIYQFPRENNDILQCACSAHDTMGMYLAGMYRSGESVPEMRENLDRWMFYRSTVLVPLRLQHV